MTDFKLPWNFLELSLVTVPTFPQGPQAPGHWTSVGGKEAATLPFAQILEQ